MDKNFQGTKEEYLEYRKKCNENNRKYYSKPDVKKQRKLYKKDYEARNKEKLRLWRKEYESRPEVIEQRKKWFEDNKEGLRIKGKEWRERNKERKRLIDKEYREKNKEKFIELRKSKEFRAKKKILYEKNKEHLKEVRKKYYKTEKGILSYKRANHIKMAIRKERPTDITREKIKNILERDKVCVYCGNKGIPELDHIIPLTKGGSCLSNNLVLSCDKCNRSKSGRDVFIWCKMQGIEVPNIVLELLEEQSKGIDQLYA